MSTIIRPTMTLATTLAIALFAAAPVCAQLNGENLLGDTGVKNGTQPAPGFYVGSVYYRYDTDTIRDRHGDRLPFDDGDTVSQQITAVVPLVAWVTPWKVLGANYGGMAVMPFARGALEAPAFGLSEHASTGASDLYVVPLQLGWHFARGDAVAAFGVFAPTGRYSSGASDNLGKGMWSYELSAGGTVYFDAAKTLSVATTAYWETHTTKDGTTGLTVGGRRLTGVRVGQVLTLEGGVARSFLHGGASLGAAYYAQFKVSEDDFGVPAGSPEPPVGRHRVWGIGPDVTLPIAARSRLLALVNVRYLWEVGARAKTQGQSVVVTTTFPVPSIRIGSTH